MKQKDIMDFIDKPQRGLISRIKSVEEKEAVTREEIIKKSKLLTRLYAKKEAHEVR